jgi:hypothetical protein
MARAFSGVAMRVLGRGASERRAGTDAAETMRTTFVITQWRVPMYIGGGIIGLIILILIILWLTGNL